MGNTLGRLFRITTFGESHGPALGVIIDGVPPGILLTTADLQHDLDRRRPGQSALTTARAEKDRAEILSGVYEGKTLGTALTIIIRNSDAKSKDYSHLENVYRPSHADYTYQHKFGFRDHRGGGRASARETAARVAAGVVAKKVLASLGVEIVAYVTQVGELKVDIDPHTVNLTAVESNPVRCPDLAAAAMMESLIKEVKKQGDSVGGVVSCVARHVPAGLGAPVFDKLEADLGKAMLSIPACKGIEFGSGFAGCEMRGSAHNDLFYYDDKLQKVATHTNYSGGIQGGISNGEHILMRMAFKPTATLLKPQPSINQKGETIELAGKGRHDPCVLPRAVPIVEAMTALVLADHLLLQRGQCGDRTHLNK